MCLCPVHCLFVSETGYGAEVGGQAGQVPENNSGRQENPLISVLQSHQRCLETIFADDQRRRAKIFPVEEIGGK